MKKIKCVYDNLNKFAFWATFSLSSILIVTSFIIPPHGVIDASVLAAVGELFAFGTLGTIIAALERGKGVVLSKGDMSVKIDDSEDLKIVEK